MLQTFSPDRSLPDPVLHVLVVGTQAPARARLAAQVLHALPSAHVHELSQVTDLVYRVAGSGVDVVVLDAEPLQLLPMTPMLVQMLKGIRPALRIVCVTRSASAPTTALTPTTDASLSEACLGAWLRSTYAHGGAHLAAIPQAARSG